jgi:hypothetical protein
MKSSCDAETFNSKSPCSNKDETELHEALNADKIVQQIEKQQRSQDNLHETKEMMKRRFRDRYRH